MGHFPRLVFLTAVALGIGMIGAVTSFAADGPRASALGPRTGATEPFAVLSCDNGQSYPIRARAISDNGDLVTGYLVLSPRHVMHIRLIPMTDGYRYAGRGIWLDGLREAAVLNFGKHHSISCSVAIG
jgi:hypothetical protein